MSEAVAHRSPKLRNPFVALLAGGALAALVFSGCRSSRGGGFEPVPGGSAEAVEAALAAREASFRGFESFARVRVTASGSARRFDARIAADANGRLLLEALSPIGTTLFSMLAENEQVVFLNHQEETAWQGNLVLLLPVLGIGAETQLRSQDLVWILAGLPLSRSDATHEPGGAGLAATRIRFGAGEVVAEYEPPLFPPSRIVLKQTTGREAGSRLEIEHLEMRPADGGAVPPLGIPQGYRCCILPDASR